MLLLTKSVPNSSFRAPLTLQSKQQQSAFSLSQSPSALSVCSVLRVGALPSSQPFPAQQPALLPQHGSVAQPLIRAPLTPAREITGLAG